ncbi:MULTISPECIES: UDP-N-acetylmuramoyl-L-alanyl-D-glutamate--2,6-diaminopimelate ligase [Moraxella]|uniref:UDP-N-acetylmuramoyl-L-alanyl-D-glutamate--2,6-diaminopimelate ligase n=1 Tax=Moraxella lacunata TaxID=477 RepID=A0A1B8PZC0_MORLA|nr:MULTISPECIES: UDP-N-acetylmuramoyl-L-alanyl-D-glutamate--2,6-diaminopimelate ligase [Moraxella]MBE9579202.1 UDP-N-acetylmuramoyl-L-alanyl-D-glutamate--2,6-diaminopimelate ligase [Moraxella sp. K1664]MBE9588544.1 UDP-N-acetylmuramoyl-L-alanyl-D-glutamate--2,6-diaminopimelate ligase [Moraxella sp. K1630]MBE9596672.1 UDP-N-acetylmuramoyl-L-alanyl-D-glutamate--2,6-diaminopimelate ligase [Moraxella sp. K2450]MDH9219345.1 UDP-N-acetylmuramoyl-L-alanyl-D-glutamate--2,6-diaminopimelate ligase [Morax
MTTFNDFAEILQPHVSDMDWGCIKDLLITGFVSDSRKVAGGEIFVLLSVNPDIKSKAKGYIDSNNSQAVLSEISASDMGVDNTKMPIVHIANLRLILGDLVKAYLQKTGAAALPKVVAVTGTNGKTTISQLTAQLLSLANHKTAVMGTAGNGILPNLTPSTHTTLEVVALQHAIYDYAQADVECIALEASSHGLHQHRLQGVPITVAVYSNLSRDHLDYHADMDDYAGAKARLFDKALFPTLTHAIINADDEFSEIFIRQAKQSGLTIWTYSTKNPKADFFAKQISPSLNGVDLVIQTPQGEMTVKSPLLGLFNVANLLASIGASLAMNVSFDEIINNIKHLKGARGRMEQVPSERGSFIVDYAHTPDALTQVLTSLKAHCTGKLIAVFGCGGDRDKGKRPLMAQAGLALADTVILTADNPRSENPNAILSDMQVGMTCDDHYRTVIEPDRKRAIELAIKDAGEQDIVVIAGKGHETYQEIQGVRYDFDDVAILGELIGKFGK